MTQAEHLLDHQCPFCGHIHDRASKVLTDDAGGPTDGDASFCISCGVIGIFASNAPGGIRKPTRSERRQLDGDPEITRVKRAWRAVTQAGKGW